MRKTAEFSERWAEAGLRHLEDAARRIDCHGVSVAGSKRSLNQDDSLILPLGPLSDEIQFLARGTPGKHGQPLLLVVADGVGGAPAGERASTLAIREIRRALSEAALDVLRGGGEHPDPKDLLKEAVHRGQAAIERESSRHPDREGMATTLTAALILWPQAHVVHVGDSRCYVFHRSSWERVTTDHTVAQQLSDRGLEAPKPSRWRNVLWNVIGGTHSEVYPQVTTLDLRWGDALLLATDGLTDSLSDAEIFRLACEGRTAEEVCTHLIEAARKSKGSDDMTVVYAQFGRSSFWRHLREILLGK